MLERIILLLGGLASVLGAYLSLRARRREPETDVWPSVEGKVFLSREVENHPHSGLGPSGRIRYSYTVDGKRYEGHRLRLFDHHTDLHGVSIRYPEGSTVCVYYDPGKPERSILDRGLDDDHTGMPIIEIIIAGLGILLIYMAVAGH